MTQEKWNDPISIKLIDYNSNSIPTKILSAKFCQTLKRKKKQSYVNYEKKENESLLDSFDKARVPKPDTDVTRIGSYKLMFFYIRDVKILNTTFSNQV